jgi:hypothetical protein
MLFFACEKDNKRYQFSQLGKEVISDSFDIGKALMGNFRILNAHFKGDKGILKLQNCTNLDDIMFVIANIRNKKIDTIIKVLDGLYDDIDMHGGKIIYYNHSKMNKITLSDNGVKTNIILPSSTTTYSGRFLILNNLLYQYDCLSGTMVYNIARKSIIVERSRFENISQTSFVSTPVDDIFNLVTTNAANDSLNFINIDNERGKIEWRFLLPMKNTTLNKSLSFNKTYIITNGNDIVSIDKIKGKKTWEDSEEYITVGFIKHEQNFLQLQDLNVNNLFKTASTYKAEKPSKIKYRNAENGKLLWEKNISTYGLISSCILGNKLIIHDDLQFTILDLGKGDIMFQKILSENLNESFELAKFQKDINSDRYYVVTDKKIYW